MSKPYVVNVSSINDFMRCKYRWYARWVLNRVPVDDARPLRFGKLFHELFEAISSGTSANEAVGQMREKWTTALADLAPDVPDWQIARDALDDLDKLAEPLSLWQDQYRGMNTLEVETPFEMPFPGDDTIIIQGRPDRVVEYDGRIYHVQHKSLAAGTNFAIYIELAKRSYHEHIYAEALQQKYPDKKYSGTIFNLYRKLKYRGVPTKAVPEGKILHEVSEIFWQHPMVVDLKSPLHEHVLDSMQHHIEDMESTQRHYQEFGTYPPPNESMNGGFYGNKPDEYFRILTGEISLDDDRYFKNRESMYAVNEDN